MIDYFPNRRTWKERYLRLLRLACNRETFKWVYYGSDMKYTQVMNPETEEFKKILITPKYMKKVFRDVKREFRKLDVYELMEKVGYV